MAEVYFILMELSLVYLLQLLKTPEYSFIIHDILLSKKLNKARYPIELQKTAESVFILFNNRFVLSEIKDISAKIIKDCYQPHVTTACTDYICTECHTKYLSGSLPVYMSKCTELYCNGEIQLIEPDLKTVIADLNTQLRL